MSFLLFKRMLTPVVIQVFFWLVVISCVIGAIYNFMHQSYMHGLEVLIIGPILLRLLCEFLIIFFRMNETLTDLKNAVQRQS